METLRRIRFQGKEWVVVGNLELGGGITTMADFESGRAGYAHLFADGRIMRYGKQIGTRADIEDLGEVTCDPDLGTWLHGMLTSPTWERPEAEP